MWGSEGRWAEIVREMIASGNYFLPTINGNVYFDKPLLSYWIILPFSFKGVVTELSARIPSAISGTGVILLTFLIGRRLFNNRTGMVSAMLLSTSVMFVLWARTASAEMLNLFMIWLAFFIFLIDSYDGSLIYIALLYIVGAIAAFCKGPVAPAVIFISIGFYSTVELLINLRKKGFTRIAFKEDFSFEFYWIFSWKGFLGLFAGLVFFTGLLLSPVLSSHSWQSVELMWRENVLRFFRPFDHIEPFYTYLKYIPLFSAPWTLLLLASIFEINNWEHNRFSRWITMIAVAIFIFFTCSGSRRSYYILPILPALAIITGKAITDWFNMTDPLKKKILHAATLITSMFLALAGIGLLFAYFRIGIPRHISQLPIGAFAVAGATSSFIMFARKKPFKGFIILFSLIFIIELWVFTIGIAAAESKRTLRPFAQKTAARLQNVSDNKIAIYQVGDSALIFYLKRNPLIIYNNPKEVSEFIYKNPDGFIIANLSALPTFQLEKMDPVIIEKPIPDRKDDPLALFAVSRK
ncbi:MAG: glycosyltransferase family 39 protein [Proteobacteria bacterium]|nr:glycosyltransferase family 39 protein [Pseudomonadota bacterium]